MDESISVIILLREESKGYDYIHPPATSFELFDTLLKLLDVLHDWLLKVSADPGETNGPGMRSSIRLPIVRSGARMTRADGKSGQGLPLLVISGGLAAASYSWSIDSIVVIAFVTLGKSLFLGRACKRLCLFLCKIHIAF